MAICKTNWYLLKMTTSQTAIYWRWPFKSNCYLLKESSEISLPVAVKLSWVFYWRLLTKWLHLQLIFLIWGQGQGHILPQTLLCIALIVYLVVTGPLWPLGLCLIPLCQVLWHLSHILLLPCNMPYNIPRGTNLIKDKYTPQTLVMFRRKCCSCYFF